MPKIHAWQAKLPQLLQPRFILRNKIPPRPEESSTENGTSVDRSVEENLDSIRQQQADTHRKYGGEGDTASMPADGHDLFYGIGVEQRKESFTICNFVYAYVFDLPIGRIQPGQVFSREVEYLIKTVDVSFGRIASQFLMQCHFPVVPHSAFVRLDVAHYLRFSHPSQWNASRDTHSLSRFV